MIVRVVVAPAAVAVVLLHSNTSSSPCDLAVVVIIKVLSETVVGEEVQGVQVMATAAVVAIVKAA